MDLGHLALRPACFLSNPRDASPSRLPQTAEVRSLRTLVRLLFPGKSGVGSGLSFFSSVAVLPVASRENRAAHKPRAGIGSRPVGLPSLDNPKRRAIPSTNPHPIRFSF